MTTRLAARLGLDPSASPHTNNLLLSAKATGSPSHTRRAYRPTRSHTRRFSAQEERDGEEDCHDCREEESERTRADGWAMRTGNTKAGSRRGAIASPHAPCRVELCYTANGTENSWGLLWRCEKHSIWHHTHSNNPHGALDYLDRADDWSIIPSMFDSTLDKHIHSLGYVTST